MSAWWQSLVSWNTFKSVQRGTSAKTTACGQSLASWNTFKSVRSGTSVNTESLGPSLLLITLILAGFQCSQNDFFTCLYAILDFSRFDFCLFVVIFDRNFSSRKVQEWNHKTYPVFLTFSLHFLGNPQLSAAKTLLNLLSNVSPWILTKFYV